MFMPPHCPVCLGITQHLSDCPENPAAAQYDDTDPEKTCMVPKELINEVFALRGGERVTIVADRPTSGQWIAVMARSVSMPDGHKEPERYDGAPVEEAAIVAAKLNSEGRWYWLQMSPATKELIGDLIFIDPVVRDCWLYAVLGDLQPAAAGG
jgi:hypothetical protein